MGEVENHAVKGLALGFVNGHGPGEAEGELFEAADDVVCNAAVCVIRLEDLPETGFEKMLLAG